MHIVPFLIANTLSQFHGKSVVQQDQFIFTKGVNPAITRVDISSNSNSADVHWLNVTTKVVSVTQHAVTDLPRLCNRIPPVIADILFASPPSGNHVPATTVQFCTLPKDPASVTDSAGE